MSSEKNSPKSDPFYDSKIGINKSSPNEIQTLLVEVALIGTGRAPSTLTYGVPEALAGNLLEGSVVEVPLGRRRVSGFVIRDSPHAAPRGLKSILQILPGATVPPDLLSLSVWAARYYQVPHAQFLRSILPPAVRQRNRSQVVPTAEFLSTDQGPAAPYLLPEEAPREDGPGLEEQLRARLPAAGLDLSQLQREFGAGTDAIVRQLVKRKLVRVEQVAIERRPDPGALVAEEVGDQLSRAPRQAAIHRWVLDRAPQPTSREEVRTHFPGSAEPLRRLLARGFLRPASREELARPTPDDAPGDTATVELNDEQSVAYQHLKESLGRFATFLLFGVTASGKTEVYLRAARDARSSGRSVLLLVPEIGLTGQLVDQASRLFPGEVTVLHSALSDRERARAWTDIATGQSPVVIGPRSAIFAPLPNLGLIVVDEEHDGAYKQEESPRYHGRDVAVMRGKLADVPVVLASATPSLESYHAARQGRYRLLQLSKRATPAPLPSVELIDLRDPAIRFRTTAPPGAEELAKEGLGQAAPLSPPLEEALVETFRAGEQSLLFLNRRGFSRVIQCDGCGHIEECPHCSVSLTIHRSQKKAACHHCGFRTTPRGKCPDCGDIMSGRSFGTEQVDHALRALLPGARIARLDRDTGRSADFVHTTLEAWRAGDLDVLVGTQMVAKGHDAPGVTLIGVILADASLHFPDFRAGERTFALLTQVSGRAGRGDRPGRVLVQTRQPDHPSLIAAAQHDFRSFAATELRARHELGYPPFGRLARIVLEGEALRIEEEASQIAHNLRAKAAAIEDLRPDDLQILGPAPAPIERLRGRHRIQVLIKAADSRIMAGILRSVHRATTDRSTRLILDVDPQGML